MQDIGKIVEKVVADIEKSEGLAPAKSKQAAVMTLSLAKALAEAVEVKAREMGVNAVIAVSNEAGHPVYTECMDGAYIASYDIAVNKAFTSVSLKMPTSALASLAAPGGSLYGIQFTNGGKIVIFGGGETLASDGKIIGGFGVSGGTAAEDTALGQFAKTYFEQHLI